MRIEFDQVTADYQIGPIKAKNVIDNVSLDIVAGGFVAVIGSTGAGKSSLLKLINGLLSLTSGQVKVGDLCLTREQNKAQLNEVRKRVGMVFQFPENQLFAETVAADIAFGPKNFGFTDQQVEQVVHESMNQVGLSTNLLDRSPFALSGGQQRRVALAGVLATRPDILILDEPGAGLDVQGREQMMSLISRLNREEKVTVILVTHNMNDVAQFANHVIVMDQGKVICHQETRTFFSQADELATWGIDLPDAVHLQMQLEKRKQMRFPYVCLTQTELIDVITKGITS